MTTVRPPTWECLCGNLLDEDCPRCILELDECTLCDAQLDDHGRCLYCDDDLWTTP